MIDLSEDLKSYYEVPNTTGRIVRLMVEKGYNTKYELAKKTHVSASTLTTSVPNNTWSMKNLEKIANHFHVSIDWLQSGIDKEPDQLELVADAVNYETGIKKVKVYDKIAAGEGFEISDVPIDTIKITHPFIDSIREELYGFIVDGDSMRPRITEGDMVITKLLKPNEKPRNKDIVVTVFRNDNLNSIGNLKLFHWQHRDKGDFVLTSINAKVPPKFYNEKSVRYFFRVYLVISKIDYPNE